MSQRRYGAVLSYASLALNIAAAFVLTPILVQMLGKGQFGLFSLMSSITAYFLLADLGLNDTVLRYIVRYMRTSREALGVFLGVTTVGYAIVVTLMGIGAAVGYTFLDPQHWPKLTAQELDDFRFMYVVGMASAGLVLLTNPIGALMAAHQKFVAIQTLAIATRLLSAVLIILYLQFGHSVRTVFVLNNVVQASICLFEILYVMIVIRPPLLLRPVSGAYVREKLGYAGPILIVVIVEMIYWRLDNIIIGSMVGTAGLAVFSIGVLFQKHLEKLATTISKVWVPKLLARLEAGRDPEATTMGVATIARLQLLIVLPVLGGVIFFGRDFLRLWLGEGFEAAWPIMLWTLIPYAIEVVGNVRNVILQVRGIYWQRAAAIIAFAILNVVVTVVLVRRIGILGAAIGTGAGLICGYIYVQWLLWRRTEYRPALFYRSLFRGIWIAIPQMAVAGFALSLWPTATWVDFIAKAAIFSAAYALTVWLVGMNRTERGYFLSFARDAGLARS